MMVDSADDIFSKVNFVSVTIATSAPEVRSVCWNPANFEDSQKTFVSKSLMK